MDPFLHNKQFSLLCIGILVEFIYIYIYHWEGMSIGGFEPPTLRLSSVYSNQLSYIPIIVINLF